MSLRRSLENSYRWLESRIAPDLEYSQHVYERTIGELVSSNTRWLDVGCGRRVLPPWRMEPERQLLDQALTVVGLDPDLDSLLDNASIRHPVCGSALCLPFPEHSFDLVTANMVVEHIDDPQSLVSEIERVLSPGGQFVLHTPNVWGYITILSRLFPDSIKRTGARILEGRADTDVFPTRYLLNSRASITAHLRAVGLSITSIRFIETNAAFQVIPPLAALELLWVRVLRADRLAGFRTNIIAISCKK